jgi:predicted DNA-binding transcriptional regulator AlpA
MKGRIMATDHANQPESKLFPPRLTVRIGDATRMLGIGRSKLYELIAAGEVETIKLGTATLVLVASIHALIDRKRAERGIYDVGP